jgi:PTS system nitrogen regulatory IIA component
MDGLRVRDILDPRRILLDLRDGTKREILSQLAEAVNRTHPALERGPLVESLVSRELICTTAIADGIAIPHTKRPLGDEAVCAFGRSRSGLDFDAIDGRPTHLLFVLISPESQPGVHLRWLAHLAVLLRNEEFRRSLLDATSAAEVLDAIDAVESLRAASKDEERS